MPDHISEKLGLTSLEMERLSATFPHIRGFLLDIGCGNNRLVKTYAKGVGVDIFDWGGQALLVKDTSDLPFRDETFDTVTFLACLNHIPNRELVVTEAARVLKDDGRIIVTMINPILGGIGHKIWWYAEDRKRETHEEELDGMWLKDVIALMRRARLSLVHLERFVYGMNNLMIFKKASQAAK